MLVERCGSSKSFSINRGILDAVRSFKLWTDLKQFLKQLVPSFWLQVLFPRCLRATSNAEVKII